MRLSKEPTQKDWILKINLKSGSGSVSCRLPRVRHTDIYRSRFYPISVVLLTLTLAVLTCSEVRLRVSTFNWDQWAGTSDDRPIISLWLSACLLLPPCSFYLHSTEKCQSRSQLLNTTHNLNRCMQNLSDKECETFSDVEFCSLAPFFVFSCSGFSLTFQFLPQKLTNISFKKLSPLKLQAHYFFHISDCRKFC